MKKTTHGSVKLLHMTLHNNEPKKQQNQVGINILHVTQIESTRLSMNFPMKVNTYNHRKSSTRKIYHKIPKKESSNLIFTDYLFIYLSIGRRNTRILIKYSINFSPNNSLAKDSKNQSVEIVFIDVSQKTP